MYKWTEGEHIEASAQTGESIGGWLYLVAVGIVLSLIMNSHHLKQLVEAAQKANWDLIWQQGPMTVLSILFEFGIQGYMLIFSIFLAVLFFGKKSNFPRMFILYVTSLFVLGAVNVLIVAYAVDELIVASVPNVTTELVDRQADFIIFVFIFGLIWIPYFLKSERVKRTFIVGKSPDNRFEFETPKILACPHCGAEYNVKDYRQDAPEWFCPQCTESLPKE